MGADAVHVGTRFIAASESLAPARHRQMVIEATSADITYTPLFSAVPANYLTASIVESGLDLNDVPTGPRLAPLQTKPEGLRAWVDILGAGQGVGAVAEREPTEEIVARLAEEYRAAFASLGTR